MTGAAPFTAIVLAGSRRPDDPVAEAAGVTHKALSVISGKTMLGRVLEALAAAPGVERIILVAEKAMALGSVEGFSRLSEDGVLTCLEAASTPSHSVLKALDAAGPDGPVLVTTADHPLLTSEMVAYFCAKSIKSGAIKSGDPGDAERWDVAVGLAPRTLLLAAYPDVSRTYILLSDDGYSGCNLFAFLTPTGRQAPLFWARGESHRKRPWRLASLFGKVNLTRYLCRRLNLEQALARASRVMKMRVGAVSMPFAEAAIDVDKPADMRLAESILEARR